ncbi:hypothetical protein C9374_001850 [Naegleria lovaniensis]|uniref:Uncharacterized protein n=1 Tax=Naegleria lovaniensis TaxID=51637 RepID=A0AA88KKH9_NAELO|nr:uncharacterized protein C9374_001850 [Naegleria lovaniensis]KAG2386815.1 hypothetical protein C9374_001850 [Naegleria lovaniensis]
MASHWQHYIDNNIVKSRYFSHGAIHGLNGTKWAQSSGIDISKNQIKTLLSYLEEERERKLENRMKSTTLNGVKKSHFESPLHHSNSDSVLIQYDIHNNSHQQATSNNHTGGSNHSNLNEHDILNSLVFSKKGIFSQSGGAAGASASSNSSSNNSVSNSFSNNNTNIGLEINFCGNQFFRIIQIDQYSALLASWNFGDDTSTASLPLAKVFDVEHAKFLIPPTHVFYCVTTLKCILTGMVNLSALHFQHEDMTVQQQFGTVRKTLDKFADYLIESGF